MNSAGLELYQKARDLGTYIIAEDLPMHINLFTLFEGNISCGDLVYREHKDKGDDVTHQSTAIARYR